MDGFENIPLDGDEGAGPAIGTATAVIDGRRGSVLEWSAGARRLLGYAAGDVTGRPAVSLLASDLPASAHRCLAERRDWNGRVSLRHRDGGRVDLDLLAHPSRDGDGGLRWTVMTITDVRPPPAWRRNERNERNERAAGDGHASAEPTEEPGDSTRPNEAALMRLAFNQSPFALAVHDTDLLCLGVNDRMCRMFGFIEDDLRGRRLTDLLSGPQYDAMERLMRQVLDTGEPVHRVTYRRVPGETCERAWSVSVSPLKDQAGRTRAVWIGVLNITEQYEARRRLTLLNEAGTQIGTTLDISRTAQELADMVVPRFADLAVVDLLEAVLSGDEPSPGPLAGSVALRRVAQQSIYKGVPETVVKPGEVDVHAESFLSARCLTTGEPILTGTNDPAFISSIGPSPARVAAISAYGLHSVLAVPIRARGVTLGVAVFVRGRREEPFERDDVLLAEELTARAALSLDNARRYTRERATALALQRSLLPQRLPVQSAFEVASRYLPASAHADVGGDWFDVIPLSGARVALVVGDVVGHGIRAAATMGRLRTAVRTLADIDLPPDELLARLDDLVSRLAAEADADKGDELDNDLGATCVYAVYDPVSRRCELARAGHPLPVLVTPDGAARLLDVPACPPLGLGGLMFESVEIELPAGSVLALYTDGIIESRDHDIDYGIERLRRALAHPEPSLNATCDNVLETVLPDRQEDDVALLVARTHALDGDQVAVWDVATDPAVVADIRKQVTTRLTGWGLAGAAFVTGLIVTELVTNAIRHAVGPIQLRLIRDQRLICEVSDGSSTAPHLRPARAFDEAGRGLLLVSRLTKRWGTRQAPHGKTIWAEQALPGGHDGDVPHRHGRAS
ncbi:MAG TPA: SpoIIE family protein phosphatase [Streptosporangiaceae bacterium]|nr:SpoIIE family protein phosphatase [Streptosporangiaceae bacterium]